MSTEPDDPHTVEQDLLAELKEVGDITVESSPLRVEVSITLNINEVLRDRGNAASAEVLDNVGKMVAAMLAAAPKDQG